MGRLNSSAPFPAESWELGRVKPVGEVKGVVADEASQMLNLPLLALLLVVETLWREARDDIGNEPLSQNGHTYRTNCFLLEVSHVA